MAKLNYKYSISEKVIAEDGTQYDTLSDFEEGLKAGELLKTFKLKSYGDYRMTPEEFISLLRSKWEDVKKIMDSEYTFELKKNGGKG